ncbi:MAG: preprotein translocase subunit SecE [Candidatus Neomarinimicrobiota bacterium]|nr:MAG: preprotein translocase subunit SecE [Candidatus Neomarinimicrobiota bacterium]
MFKKIKQFIDEVQFEMSKVSWPNWNELRGSTYIVLTLSLILAVYLFIVDFVLNRLVSVIL